jgi:predicted DCC family thiol-disulfide oxidoreductase YuxK
MPDQDPARELDAPIELVRPCSPSRPARATDGPYGERAAAGRRTDRADRGDKARPTDHRLLVLFDGDCGVCTSSARWLGRLDRHGRLELIPLQAALGMPDAPSIDVLLDAMHVRDSDGGWSVGGAAWIRISREVALLRPFGLLARLPLLRRFVEPTYALVARNRHRISRALGADACRIDPGTG